MRPPSRRWWLLLVLPLLASCWVTNAEVRRKVQQYDDDPVETADTGL